MRHHACLLVCLLMVCCACGPSVGAHVTMGPQPQRTRTGSTLYVGGSGPGNYTHIQDAINASVDGDTVFVYDDSAPYYETIVINRSISLIGEQRNTTIIDGENSHWYIVTLTAGHILVRNITVQHSEGAGILIQSNQTAVMQTVISDCHHWGVLVFSFGNPIHGTRIQGNTVLRSWTGIECHRAVGTMISGNLVSGNTYGIALEDSFSNTITTNVVSGNSWGIWDFYDRGNRFERNSIENNTVGMELVSCGTTSVTHNNFQYNSRHATFVKGGFYEVLAKLDALRQKDVFLLSQYRLYGRTLWWGNYWGGWHILPYCISGTRLVYPFDGYLTLPLAAYDWHPASRPYTIPTVFT